MLDKKTLLIFTVILLSTTIIIGSMFTITERFDRRYVLESRIAELRAENMKLEALLDQALKTLHHERMMHFGEVSGDKTKR
jgi:hypothetical protein